MYLRIFILGFFLSCFSISSFAHESEKIKQLEREVKELNNRISELESKLSTSNKSKNDIVSGEGWELLSNWRKLKTGMSYKSVEEILGPPHVVKGGALARWNYNNGGQVVFIDGELYSWDEPRF